AYVKVARDEGGEVLCGGRAPDDPALARGCYVEPTVGRADPAARVNREEVFGPFVTVTAFSGEDQALELANSVDYGLGGGLWTRDLARAPRGPRATRRAGGCFGPWPAPPIPRPSGSTSTRTCPAGSRADAGPGGSPPP